MKKTILSAVLFLMITATAFAGNLDGNWVTKVKGQDGNDMELSFVFKQDGDKLTGAIKTPNGDMPLSNLKVVDKAISFEVVFGDMKMKHVGTIIDDDTISLKTVDSPMGNSEMILKRQK